MMKENLEFSLVRKYPKIFRNYGGDKEVTCMHWGFEHRDGWFDLLNVLCQEIQHYVDSHKEIPQVVADQVKEKFGGLRFYCIGGDDYVNGMITLAEEMSYLICEMCGSTKNITQTSGWIKTLCEECKKNERNET